MSLSWLIIGELLLKLLNKKHLNILRNLAWHRLFQDRALGHYFTFRTVGEQPKWNCDSSNAKKQRVCHRKIALSEMLYHDKVL